MRSRLHGNRKAILCGASFVVAALLAAPAFATPVTYRTITTPPRFATPPPDVEPRVDMQPEPEPVEVHSSNRETGAGVLFFGFGSAANIHNLALTASDEGSETDPLKGKKLRLEGGGQLMGGGIQINIYGRYVRGGLTLSAFGVDATRLEHDALSNQFSARPSTAWGAGIDVFLGHEFRLGAVRPYIDLVGSFAAASLDIDLMHPTFGKLGRTTYDAWSFGFGPRVGLTIPVGDHAFFDLSGMYSIVGMERFRAVAGIGFRSF